MCPNIDCASSQFYSGIRGMEMSSTTWPQWTSAANYFKGAFHHSHGNRALSQGNRLVVPLPGEEKISHFILRSRPALWEACTGQQPAKKDWKTKHEPQLLKLFLGRAYVQELGLPMLTQVAAGLEKNKVNSVNPSELCLRSPNQQLELQSKMRAVGHRVYQDDPQ